MDPKKTLLHSVITVGAIILLAGCANNREHFGSQSAPVRVLQGLESQALSAESLNLKQIGQTLSFPFSWDAPDEVRVPLKLQDGLPRVQCSVNGHEVWMVVDTGSENCVLEGETALQCGVRTVKSSALKIEIGGSSGRESAVVGVPDSIVIGKWHWDHVPCVVRTHQSEEVHYGLFFRKRVPFNIIGLNILRSMCSYVILDYPHGEAVFGFKKPCPQANSAGTTTDLEFHGGLPYVRASESGREWMSMLDTGASTQVEIDWNTAAAIGLLRRAYPIEQTHIGLGQSDNPIQTTLEAVMVSNLSCFGRNFERIHALVVHDRSKIGTGLLKRFRVTLDFKQSLLLLEAPGRSL